ncbi:bifunctional helix-turn-helix domain-containing protein/methylated-DNA--[protein]-cysteine S-methyltransferase [Aestuariivirga litoralis]|uniref:bifunctional helix-turn-helix domain-containing protein/methylated-DNA--[protein]-cysteine S-methyltransferase n=1 Tax=Aestuariivirga litoralis TaxID=2650924 RepID=UPI0018C61EF1|nr:bifunctional helix-turn-helix domain-containing protein/methylated-DNA--[protein]-cysteine S-methyltransferase [Aestuariivirga litoralis]MBG1232010.1 methylated-DNA--[protein]-cysteine S-methyltransferase [Aestuariivirga litoralis]
MENTSPLDDYAKVRSVLEHLTSDWRDQPSLAELAAPVGLSEDALQKLFTRWAGLTPKAFLQALTLDHARNLLKDSASILDAALDSGLSGPGRLHDLFIAHEAMSPGAYKAKGAGLAIYYGFHPSPFGIALAMVTEHGLCGLSFADQGGEKAALEDMMRRWPNAQYTEDSARTAPYVARVFGNIRDGQPLRITMIGSDFEIRVWETLLKIPCGKAVSYGDIAANLGKPLAARAVGAAVGRNPISFVVPCHRVIGKSGALTGYHWGLTRKKAIMGWEAGQVA